MGVGTAVKDITHPNSEIQHLVKYLGEGIERKENRKFSVLVIRGKKRVLKLWNSFLFLFSIKV